MDLDNLERLLIGLAQIEQEGVDCRDAIALTGVIAERKHSRLVVARYMVLHGGELIAAARERDALRERVDALRAALETIRDRSDQCNDIQWGLAMHALKHDSHIANPSAPAPLLSEGEVAQCAAVATNKNRETT